MSYHYNCKECDYWTTRYDKFARHIMEWHDERVNDWMEDLAPRVIKKKCDFHVARRWLSEYLRQCKEAGIN